jgi:ribosomal protein S12 methylthiotransferase
VKAHLVTLGCPKNLVDSEAATSILRQSGCEVTDDPARADVLMVSACSFLESAWNETVEETRRLARYKRAGGKRLVLMGCLPRHRNLDLERELPWVDHFLPTGAHANLAAMVEAWGRERPVPRVLERGELDRFAGFETREILTPSHAAYVKVAEGCNRRCTFCAIPAIRGRQVSRSVDSIAREVDGLVARGVREVTLLAQDIVSYRDGNARFADLVDRVVQTGVEWVRIFYVHPAGLGVEHLAPVFAHASVCRYLEMPVQHSSSRLLERMRRSYDRAHLERLLHGIREAFPDAVIRSEVIVGFPGERDEDFEDLKAFIGDFTFDSLGVFTYSPEPGTEAASYPDAVAASVARERAAELASLQEAFSFGARARFRGRILRVLVDRPLDAAEGTQGAGFAGRFYGQAPEIDGEVFLAGPARAGEFVEARVTETDVFDLRADVLPAAS